jgi:phosphonate transport system substrate-binding protein
LKLVRFLTLLLLCALAPAAAARDGSPEEPIRIGFNGGENPGIIRIKANSFAAFLEERSGIACEAVIAESYSQLIRAIAENKVDFSFLSPLGYITAEQVARAELLLKSVRGGQPFYWSVILVRKDSGLRGLDDLKDKRFAFTHLGSTSGYVIPMSSLLGTGIRPDDYFSEVIYAGGHSAVIRMILDGDVDAGATFADDPQGKVGSWTAEEFVAAEEARQLKPIFFSEKIPGDTFIVTRSMREEQPELVESLSEVLIAMGDSRAGHTILLELYNIDSLQKAASEDYEPVRLAFQAVREKR